MFTAFAVILLYVYFGNSINISIKFTVQSKDSFVKPPNTRDWKPPNHVMNAKKRNRHSKTTPAPPTSASATQEVMTSTAKFDTSSMEDSTSPQKIITWTTNLSGVPSTAVSVMTKPKAMPTAMKKATTLQKLVLSTVKPLTSAAKSPISPDTTTQKLLTSTNPVSTTPLAYRTLSIEAQRVVSKKISSDNKRIMMDILRQFIILADHLNLTYFVSGGTLLGSWRHHALVPWDDDLDVLVNITQKTQLLSAISQLEPQYKGPDGSVIKFHSNESSIIPGHAWGWPFMDIAFFNDNGKVLWNTVKYFSGTKYDLERMFPLHKRPFETFEVNAPRDSLYFLENLYKSSFSGCRTWPYNHAKESGGQTVQNVSCESLKDIVPFVHRHFINGTMKEELRLGSKVIHTKYILEEKGSLCYPYNLTRIKS
jgi:hypothetical protein